MLRRDDYLILRKFLIEGIAESMKEVTAIIRQCPQPNSLSVSAWHNHLLRIMSLREKYIACELKSELEDMREFWVIAGNKYNREGNRVDFIRCMSNLAELYTEFERQQLDPQVLST